MFLVCQNHELVGRAYEAVLREAERDRRFAALVAQAADRVLKFKKRTKELHDFPARPKPAVMRTLRTIMNDFSKIVEEIRA
jgi:hypothetical protein